MMKKVISVMLILCMLVMAVPVSYAGGEELVSVIQTYSQLAAWCAAGCPDTVNYLMPDADFGWPATEVELDFSGHSFTHGLPLQYASWTIPSNVTIRNLFISVKDSASLTINGRWYNEMNGSPADNIIVTDTTLTLGKGADVTGQIRLCVGSELVGNDAYAQAVMASKFISGAAGTEYATISGTLQVDQLGLNQGMTMYADTGCNLEVAGFRNADSSSTFYIRDGAQVLVAPQGYSSIGMSCNTTIASGGNLMFVADFPPVEGTLNIQEGGVVETYGGLSLTPYYSEGKITGNGTINLNGYNPLRYEVEGSKPVEYDSNTGDIPNVDATVVINLNERCDHADGKAYMMENDYMNQGNHVLICKGCYLRQGESSAPHEFVFIEEYDTSIHYQCTTCSMNKYVQKITGECGEDLSYSIAGDKLTLVGSGTMNGYADSDSPWAANSEEIKSIEVGGEVTGIGAGAFDGCTALETVSIPAGITTIDVSAFAACDALTTVEYGGTYEDWKQIDIKEGNDAFAYAEITFADDSKLLAPTEQYRGTADILYKDSVQEETASFEVSMMFDADATADTLAKTCVYTAVYDDNGKLVSIEAAQKQTSGSSTVFTGEIPDAPYKMLLWGANCFPVTKALGE